MEVSIVIPCYNKEQFIADCIKSITSQDFPSFDVHLIDDGSTDRTGVICDQLASSDPRLHVYHLNNNGVTAARRYGVDHSLGRYVMFVDCDDQLTPGAIQTLYDWIEKTQADEVIGTCITQKGNVRDSGLRGWQDSNPLIYNLLAVKNTILVLWGAIFRRELLEGCLDIPREIICGEDILMQIKCLIKRPKVYFIPDHVYFYNEGLPHNRIKTLEQVRIIDKELKETLLPRWNEFEQGYLHHCIKNYEAFINGREFYVYEEYYKKLKQEDLSHLPWADRIAFILPPRIAFFPIWIRKKLG